MTILMETRLSSNLYIISDVNIRDNNNVITHIPLKAMWDTGANKSALCLEIPKANNLAKIGTDLWGYKPNALIRDKFLIHIEIGERCFESIEVLEAPYKATNFDIIIGMDIISLGNLSIIKTNNGNIAKFEINED